MTFLVYFLFPLLAYVFIPRVDSTRDVSGNADSEKGNLEMSTKRSSIEPPRTDHDAAVQSHRGDGRRHQRHKVRQSSYRSEKRRHLVNDNENHELTNNEDPAPVVTEEATEYHSAINTATQRDDTDTQAVIQHSEPEDDIETESVEEGTTDPQVSNEEEHGNVTYDEYANYTSERNETNTSTQNELITASSPTACPKCGSREEQKRLHVEMFKQTLLSKLGMETAPKVEGPLPPLPFDFYLGEDFTVSDEPDDDDERRTVKTREIFIFGTDVTHRCHNRRGTGCYNFNLTDTGLDTDEIASVELWIYKQQDLNDRHIQTFMVSELDQSNRKVKGERMLRSRNIVKRIETRLKDGWMKIYVTRTVMRWLSKPQRNNGLAVICKTCQRHNHKTIYGNKEGMMPILVFYMRQSKTHRRRYRRETDCIEGGNNCCHKETLMINFRDIGWDYIMAPSSIRPNYCTGSCNGIQAAYYNHTKLVQTLQQSVMHNYGSHLQPCCSPVSFRQPQSLIYRDHHGAVRKIDVPDLIVGECGCT